MNLGATGATAHTSYRADLEKAKEKWNAFKQEGLFHGRKCCLIDATNYLKRAIENGELAEQLEATSLAASVNLEMAKLEWLDFQKQTLQHLQEGCLLNTTSYLKHTLQNLKHTLQNGTTAEQQEASSLKASVNLEMAKLKWLDFQKPTSQDRQLCCLMDTTSYLKHTLQHGTAAEQQKATSLQATVNLELAKLEWSDFRKKHTRDAQKCCMEQTSNYLEFTLTYGTTPEQEEAKALLDNVERELARH